MLTLDQFRQFPNRNENYKRLDKHTYFFEIAKLVSKRSCDSVCQHGCCLVKNGVILSTGYNSFIANSPDHLYPNQRPFEGCHFAQTLKTPLIIHAESNALLNAAKNGINIDGAEIYLTGMSCVECTKQLIQCNILKWYIGDVTLTELPEQKILREWLINYHGVTIVNMF